MGCRLLIQAAGPVLILVHAQTVVIAQRPPVQARRVVLRRLGKPVKRLFGVLFHPVDAIQTVDAHLHCGVGIAVLRRLAAVLQGLPPPVRQLQQLRGKGHDLGVLIQLSVVRHKNRSLPVSYRKDSSSSVSLRPGPFFHCSG